MLTALLLLQSTLVVYLDSGGAPAQWERAAEDSIRKALVERGVTLLPEPVAAASAGDAKIATAKKDLERGIAAYRALALDGAVNALNAAQAGALAAPESREAPAIVADARVYLGVVALATGNAAESDKQFRRVAIADPERKLSSKSFSPDIVKAYEKARKAVIALPKMTLAIDAPAEAALLVDGRSATSPLEVPPGEHVIAAISEAGAAGTVSDAPSVQLRIVPDGAKALAAMRAAAKSRDDAALARAIDSLALATQAARVLTWDLRSKEGRVEAPMRMKESGKPQFRFAVAELGSAPGNTDKPVRAALSQLLAKEVASRNGGTPPVRKKSRYGWAWWAGGAAAVLAAGAAGAVLAQPPAGEDKVNVIVEK